MRTILHERLIDGRVRRGLWGSDDSYGLTGMFIVWGPCAMRLKVVASSGEGWEHVSVSCERRTPNWQEMCFVKNLFWEEEETAVQFHPPRSQYVNHHPHCLHIWRPLVGEIILPAAHLVGPMS